MIACDEGGFTVEYRVFSAGGDGIWIIEVHTDLITLEPTSDLKPVAPRGWNADDVVGLKRDVQMMLTAFEKPVMTGADFADKGRCSACGEPKYHRDC